MAIEGRHTKTSNNKMIQINNTHKIYRKLILYIYIYIYIYSDTLISQLASVEYLLSQLYIKQDIEIQVSNMGRFFNINWRTYKSIKFKITFPLTVYYNKKIVVDNTVRKESSKF